jgi:hypothetical protein
VDCFVSETVMSEVIYAGGQGGIWKSTNAGESWEPLPESSADVRFLAINPIDTSVIYAGNSFWIYKRALTGARERLLSRQIFLGVCE